MHLTTELGQRPVAAFPTFRPWQLAGSCLRLRALLRRFCGWSVRSYAFSGSLCGPVKAFYGFEDDMRLTRIVVEGHRLGNHQLQGYLEASKGLKREPQRPTSPSRVTAGDQMKRIGLRGENRASTHSMRQGFGG
jgi:hypothetical protein